MRNYAGKEQEMANHNPLNQWVKGQSGNPKGHIKREWTWDSLLVNAVEESAKDGNPIKYHIARSLIAECLKGNIQAIKILMDRMDGLPKQPLQHDGEIKSCPMIRINECSHEENYK